MAALQRLPSLPTKARFRMIQYLPFIGSLVSSFFGSKEKRDQYQADARTAVYSQFAAEFGHGKTWWDSIVDGLNRLPRPFMTFGTIYLFYLCWHDPEKFIEGAVALQAMPQEGWYVLGAIVTFWFAAKLPKDFGKYKLPLNKIPDIVDTVTQVSKRLPNATGDPQEGMDWQNKVETRYAHEENSRYNN